MESVSEKGCFAVGASHGTKRILCDERMVCRVETVSERVLRGCNISERSVCGIERLATIGCCGSWRGLTERVLRRAEILLQGGGGGVASLNEEGFAERALRGKEEVSEGMRSVSMNGRGLKG